ncbi:hypothetical protein MMC11_006757 [Xylographa trunciseda]|nr:hypothetical protein [Xylographa trunciseda]
MTAFLLRNGADANVTVMNPEMTLLSSAAARESTTILRMLLEHGARVEKSHVLEAAAKGGHGPNAEILLQAGADINEVPAWGGQPGYDEQAVVGTALHAAIKKGHVDFAKWFVQRGADWTLLNDEGKTAVEVAIEEGWDEEKVKIFVGSQ